MSSIDRSNSGAAAAADQRPPLVHPPPSDASTLASNEAAHTPLSTASTPNRQPNPRAGDHATIHADGMQLPTINLDRRTADYVTILIIPNDPPLQNLLTYDAATTSVLARPAHLKPYLFQCIFTNKCKSYAIKEENIPKILFHSSDS